MSLHDAAFCRPTTTSPLGKCDQRLDIPVQELLKDRLIALAAMHDMSTAEYARFVLEMHVFGSFSMLQSVARRVMPMNPENIG